MFGWFKKKEPEKRYDTYSPKERMIFHYFDGQKVIDVDPMPIYRKFLAVRDELWKYFELAYSPSKDAGTGLVAAVKIARGIFNLKTQEEGGLCEPEVMELLDTFLNYTEGVKKNSSLTAMFLNSMEGALLRPSATSPPTTNTSDSGLTAPVNPTVAPTPSLREQPSPSGS